MTEPTPPSEGSPPARRASGMPAGRAGLPTRGGAVPRMETVRVTSPDLQRRAALERSRLRLLLASAGFGVLFLGVVGKLASATLLFPMAPSRAEMAPLVPNEPPPLAEGDVSPLSGGQQVRATIMDRNGQILAVSLPTAALYANPREMIDPGQAAHRIKEVLPSLDEAEAKQRLASAKQFVYLARNISQRQEVAINALGIPGVYFQPTEKRHYPLGRVAAQVLGGVDIDGRGVAGVERAFDARLEHEASPIHLSIDVRVQEVMREELDAAKTEFDAIGACGIVMDVRTGEVIAMVSLPDYDANLFGQTPPDDRFNRAVTGMFEPGSTFKLQTAAMALDYGAAHIWDRFDAAHLIHIGRFTITDFKGQHRILALPEVLAYSSNLGAAHIALTVGGEHQRAWLKRLGMFRRVGIQLPEAGFPIIPPLNNWGESTVMTVGFGHGIAVSPLHVVRGTAALANGGTVLTPTILADMPGQPLPDGRVVMSPSTSDTVRRLMRLVVTNGYGKPADVAGYFVGGKTGTAEKVGAHGYKKHANVSAFMSVFPMNAPRYAVYFMLDEPKGNKSTGGYSTAGAVSAPGAGRVIARIAPMLNMFPDTAHLEQIQASLAIPMQPERGSGEPTGLHPWPDPPPVATTATAGAAPAQPQAPAKHGAVHQQAASPSRRVAELEPAAALAAR